MSRESRNKIVLSEGTEAERTIYLKRPKGRKAREMMPKVLAFMSDLSKVADDGGDADDIESVLSLVNKFWSAEVFENELVPFVLQMESEDDKKYLNEECTIVDIIDGFTKAAQFLIEESFQRKEVQEAMGKSTEEAQEAQKKK